ncbi:MAG: hypothetical protein PHW64_01345 [Sulfuricurvum sp.]|nr:hypothetical protein [Sulfuricurvum sp.]
MTLVFPLFPSFRLRGEQLSETAGLFDELPPPPHPHPETANITITPKTAISRENTPKAFISSSLGLFMALAIRAR